MIECPKTLKVSKQVVKLITRALEKWNVELATGRQAQAEVKIRRGIFQVDLLSLLLFVITMISLNYMLRKIQKKLHIYKVTQKDTMS